MKRILEEPLLHFLLIGATLFGLFAVTGEKEDGAQSNRRIVVSSGRVEQLTRIFTKTWQRPPTAGEIKGLVDDFVLEEACYRKALEMGLDRDDTMIRRRMRQKLEYLSDDVVTLTEPGDEDLEAYLAAHTEKFAEDPVFTFRQIYFNPERHGDDPLAAVRAQAETLRSGGSVEGDSTLLPSAFEKASQRTVDTTFGGGFAARLKALEPGAWSDPIRSGLGLHLVKLDVMVPARLPLLAEVRRAVLREWQNEKRLETREKFNQALLEDYEVVIEWPDTDATGESNSDEADS